MGMWIKSVNGCKRYYAAATASMPPFHSRATTVSYSP